jgi:PAS domain S-box-containing protein
MELSKNPLVPAPLSDVLVEQAPDAVIFADAQGAIRIWNGRAQQIFGYAASEALGESLNIIIPERLRAAHWRGFEAALTTRQTKYAGRVLTTRSVHKDGRTLYVDLSFALIDDANGNVLGVLAIARDATERYLEHKKLLDRVGQLEAKLAPPG